MRPKTFRMPLVAVKRMPVFSARIVKVPGQTKVSLFVARLKGLVPARDESIVIVTPGLTWMSLSPDKRI